MGEIKKNKNQLKNDFKVRNSNKKITIKSKKKKKNKMKDNFKPWQTSMSPKRIREKRGRRREKKKIVCHTLSAYTRVTLSGRSRIEKSNVMV